MTRFSVQRSPSIQSAKKPFSQLTDALVRAEMERGSEAHPGDCERQLLWDEYLDAVHLASVSGERDDKLSAARLYLRYLKGEAA